MRKFEKQAVIYTSSCHGLVHILELTYGAVLIGIAQEFGTSLFVLGILANIMGFAFGIMALPIGLLADRVSERRLLMLCCLGMAVSSIAIGLSPNIQILRIALLALGLSLGIYHPAGSAFIARVATNRGLGFGYVGVGGNIGLALGPILASVIASALGWRSSYLIFAIPAIFLAVMFFFFNRTEAPTTQQPIIKVSTGKTALRPFILPLALIFCASIMNGFIYRGTVTFLPLYLSERVHFSFLNLDSILAAGSFASIAFAFGVGGQFLGGYLSEKKRRESLALVIAIATVPLLTVIGNTEGLALMTAAAAFAFFIFMGQPIYSSLIADYSPPDWRGRLYGIAYFCSFGLGSFSASILGYVAVQFGTNWIFMVAAGFGLITLACTTCLLLRALKTSKHNR